MTQRVTYIKCNTILERDRNDPTERHKACDYAGCTATLWVNDSSRESAQVWRNNGYECYLICYAHTQAILEVTMASDGDSEVYDMPGEIGMEVAKGIARARKEGQLVPVNKPPELWVRPHEMKLRNGWITSQSAAVSYYRHFINAKPGDVHSVTYFDKSDTGSIIVVDEDPENENGVYTELVCIVGGSTDGAEAFRISNVPVKVVGDLLATTNSFDLFTAVIANGGIQMNLDGDE